MQKNYDVIVIGGGPAGCSAASYIARCKWKVLILDRGIALGHLGGLGNVSYFPGFPEPISGEELVKRMRRQAELMGVHVSSDEVTAVSSDTQPFKLLTNSGKEYEARAVIVATGSAARTNYLFGEREFMGRGVSHDAISDGPGVAKRVVAVIGKSRQAAEEAMVLTRFAEHVHFIIPSSKLEADDALLGRLQRTKAIEMHLSTSLKRINGEGHVKSITVFSSGQEKEMQIAGVFTYVHEYKPTTAFLEKVVELAPNGAVKVGHDMAASADGFFACGDVLCGRPQLPAVSSAQGLLAGISADRFLMAKIGE